MNEVLAKIIARKNAADKKQEPAAIGQPSAVSTPTDLQPCPTCDSAIRWLNAAGAPRCIGCQPPKTAALVRSRQVLTIRDQSTGKRAWERLVELPDGRLASETGIRELVARGELSPSTAASVGIDSGEGEGGDDRDGGTHGATGLGQQCFDGVYREFTEIDPDEYFSKPKHGESYDGQGGRTRRQP